MEKKELENLKASPRAQYKSVSIVIPVHNEARTIETVIELVAKAQVHGLQKEIILIDDASNDGTVEILKKINRPEVKIIFLKDNTGKGAVLNLGFKQATGDIILIQDADLEYDPYEYEVLLKPFFTDKADVVYGSRYLQSNVRQVPLYWHTVFNKMFSHFSNFFTNMYVTDVMTCYKVFNRIVLNEVVFGLTSKRFGFEVEFTARIARKNYKIIEVPISYYPRTIKAGKHMKFKDALECLWSIFKYNIFK